MENIIREKFITIYDVEYIVSNDGRVYSTKNVGRGKYHQELKQHEDEDGYLCVTVGKNGKRRKIKVHRIIAMAFIPNPNNLPEVDHIDNNKKNNCVSNLQWITGYDNKSKIPFETRSKTHSGILNGRAILTPHEVEEIRELYRSGLSRSEIAKRFGRGWTTINHIVKGNTWKNITTSI